MTENVHARQVLAGLANCRFLLDLPDFFALHACGNLINQADFIYMRVLFFGYMRVLYYIGGVDINIYFIYCLDIDMHFIYT